MAKRKFGKDEIKFVLASFSAATYQEHGSHSFAAGYFESLIASILVDSPRHKQIEIMMQIADHEIDAKIKRAEASTMAKITHMA